MCNEASRKRWREKMVNLKIHQELEIREKEEECKRKREVMASVLEKRAEKS